MKCWIWKHKWAFFESTDRPMDWRHRWGPNEWTNTTAVCVIERCERCGDRRAYVESSRGRYYIGVQYARMLIKKYAFEPANEAPPQQPEQEKLGSTDPTAGLSPQSGCEGRTGALSGQQRVDRE